MLIAACLFIAAVLLNVDVGLAGWCCNAAPARTNTKSSETEITSPSTFHRTPAGRRKAPHPSAAFASNGPITGEASFVFIYLLLVYFIYSGLTQTNSSHLLPCLVAKPVLITPAKQLLSQPTNFLIPPRRGPTTKMRDATRRRSSEGASGAAANSARRRAADSLSNDSTTAGI